MAYARKPAAAKKSTPETCRNAETGAINCPICGHNMVPMNAGKGFRCGVPGNRFNGKGWSICNGTIWNNTTFATRPVIVRAEKFPVMASPTAEQIKIRKIMSQSPSQRGGRCVLIDAGPGTGKTTTLSWGSEALYQRLGNLKGFPMLAFNVNAKDVMQGKLPIEVPDVATINSWCGQAQGYRRPSYDAGKLRTMGKELVDHLPNDERPSLNICSKIVERMRDVCLFSTDEGDHAYWATAISTVLARFPGLGKKVDQIKDGMALCREYVPALFVRSHSVKTKIDIQEQFSRPVTEAIRASGWRMRFDCVSKPANEWSDDDVSHFAKLIRSITIPALPGAIVDEAQDLGLCQIAVILAQVWRTGELFLIGDDKAGEYGEDDFKAGQAIYGWRGAFGGSLKLISRLWQELTGENAVQTALTITFRHGEEICAAYRPLNNVIKSGITTPNYSQAWRVNGGQAFTAWLQLPADRNALWVTRTNAPLSVVLIETLKEHQECCIRGGADFMGTVDAALYNAAGWADTRGEYTVPLKVALAKLEQIADEADAESNGQPDPNSIERFLLGLGKAIQADPKLLLKASLSPVANVGNLRRFIAHYANRDSRRVLTTVYRCKGDEADLVIVDDAQRFNETWGDTDEDRACRHVALSRAKRVLLTVGKIAGSDMETAPDEMFTAE